MDKYTTIENGSTLKMYFPIKLNLLIVKLKFIL